MLLKERWEQKDEEADVSSYWMSLRKWEHTGTCKRKH